MKTSFADALQSMTDYDALVERAGTKEPGWRLSINYGPDGEEDWANVYDEGGALVGNLRAHHARQIVAAFNTIAKLQHDNDMLTRGGIIEVAVRNPSVADYMKHWEGRAETAEAALARTPSREAVLEEAAKVAETPHEDDDRLDRLIRRQLAAAIRSLSKPSESAT